MSVHPLHPAARNALGDKDARSARSRSFDQRYLPTLFDRLCDDAPSELKEAPNAFVPDRRRMREILQRDLSLLLNTLNHETYLAPERYPQVATSCVNYGVPGLASKTLTERQWVDIETAVRLAILRFEPRISPQSLSIRPMNKDQLQDRFDVVTFEISGQVHMLPYPMEFIVQSSADLEAMRMEVKGPSLDAPPSGPLSKAE